MPRMLSIAPRLSLFLRPPVVLRAIAGGYIAHRIPLLALSASQFGIADYDTEIAGYRCRHHGRLIVDHRKSQLSRNVRITCITYSTKGVRGARTRGPMALKRDVLHVARQLEGCAELTNLICDDACVHAKVHLPGQFSANLLAIHFMGLEAYPYCPCLALCEV